MENAQYLKGVDVLNRVRCTDIVGLSRTLKHKTNLLFVSAEYNVKLAMMVRAEMDGLLIRLNDYNVYKKNLEIKAYDIVLMVMVELVTQLEMKLNLIGNEK